MPRKATPISLTEEDRATLKLWARSATSEQRFALRARIILAAASGQPTDAIAQRLRMRTATVSKWRTRFARHGLGGLQDAPRPGQPKRYDEETEHRILDLVSQPPPAGHATWTAALVAETLGEVSVHHVWRVLGQHKIHLQRRRSYCVSTDPEFAAKAADIVGLYSTRRRTRWGCVSTRSRPSKRWSAPRANLRLPRGAALSGFSHRYQRHGTTTLFAALEVATGHIQGGHAKRRRRREFLDFMNDMVAAYPAGQTLHVILDNLNTHKPKRDRWLARHPNVHFHYTPTNAC